MIFEYLQGQGILDQCNQARLDKLGEIFDRRLSKI